MNKYQAASIIGQAVVRCAARCEVHYYDRVVQFYNHAEHLFVEMYAPDAAEALARCNTGAEFWAEIKKYY